jgi:hypothetical protein
LHFVHSEAKQYQLGKMDKILYKTQTPFSFYFWMLTTILFATIVVFKSDNFLAPIIYIPIFSVAIYLYFANYSGRLILTSDKIMVKYSITTFLNYEILLDGIKEYDYKKGFYDLMSSKRYGVNDFVPQIFFDTIKLKFSIKNKNGVVELREEKIKINTRMFQLDKFLCELSKIKRIKETVN